MLQEFLSEYGTDLRTDAFTHQDLWDKAEIAKKDLSFRNSVVSVVSAGGNTIRIDLDREKFDELISDIVDQTEQCLNRVINDSGIEWTDVDTVLLVGGSSRIPVVKEMIERITGKQASQDTNPDECVAEGAAIQALLADEGGGNSSAPEVEEIANIVVHDVASHSLGVKALSSDRKSFVNSIIIPRLTSIPCAMTKTYATSENNQKKIEIEILQGEDENPKSPDIELIGKAGLNNLPSHKAGDLLIEITLKYTPDGVIEVVAKELHGGETSREVVMKKNSGLSEDLVSVKQKILDELDL